MDAQEPLGHSPASEAQLISDCRSGKRDQFPALIDPYLRSLEFIAYSILRNQHDTEEVVQEAILKAFAHIQQLREGESFKPWLLQIAANEARMRVRKDRKHLYASVEEEITEKPVQPRQFVDWRNVPSAELERKELRTALTAALACLGDGYREVFVLRDIQQLSAADTGKILDISEPAVHTRLHRARMQMREHLTPLFRAPGSKAPGMSMKMMALMGKTWMRQTISCRKATSQLSRYIDDQLTPEVCVQIETHLRLCDRCSVVLDTTRKLLYVVGNEKIFEVPFKCNLKPEDLLAGKLDQQSGAPG